MFRFADLNRVIWPVTIGEGTFRVDFAIFNRKQLRERQRRALEQMAGKINAEGAPKSADDVVAMLDAATAREDGDEAELLARVKGWFDVEDGSSQPVPFSVERLQAMLDTDYGFQALMRGLMQASREGPAKNSPPGPAGMPARDQA